MSKSVTRQKLPSRKRGDKTNEMAVKHRKVVANFKTSKDIHEDRGTLQTKLGCCKEKSFIEK